MPAFGKRSLSVLSTVDSALVQVLDMVIENYDFSAISGKRDKAEQDDIFARGMSKVKWPHSKHNVGRGGITSGKSLAVDIAPYPIDWKDTYAFVYLAGRVQQAASELGYTVRWGGNWDQDHDIIKDQTFQDLGHFELIV